MFRRAVHWKSAGQILGNHCRRRLAVAVSLCSLTFKPVVVITWLTHRSLIQANTISSRSHRRDEDEGMNPHKSCLLYGKV